MRDLSDTMSGLMWRLALLYVGLLAIYGAAVLAFLAGVFFLFKAFFG